MRLFLISLVFVSLFAYSPFAHAEGSVPNVPCVPQDFQGPLPEGTVYCEETVKLLGIDFGCYASLPPDDSQGNGCGLDDFIRVLKRIIGYLTVIIIPLAAGIVVWGGLVIMTAAGSVERINKGKAVITTAIVGILIAFGSWLIVNTIYAALTKFGGI